MNLDKKQSLLDRWQITEQELTEVVDENPSLRGMLLGYVAEKKFFSFFIKNNNGLIDLGKADDHDRMNKGDRKIMYNGIPIVIEVKSLQGKTVKERENGRWSGSAQVDASDCRTLFIDGEKVTTTCLLKTDFDLLVVNCFAFGEVEWRFLFARACDLPTTNYKNYSEKQKAQLLKTLVYVPWPPEPPFFEIQDENGFIETIKNIADAKRERIHKIY